MPDRERYSEAEVRAILKRAAERQHRADLSAEARASGLTKREVEQVAAAAGIEPRHVAAAIRDAERAEPAVPTSIHDRLTGKPTRIHLERSAPGHLDETLWQKLVVELRRTFDTPGIPSALGTQREWRSNPSVQDQAEFLAEEVDGEVRLTLRRSWLAKATGPLASLAMGGGMSSLFVLLGLFGRNRELALIWATVIAVLALVGFVVARASYRRFADKQTARFEGLMNRLEGIVDDHRAAADSVAADPVAMDAGAAVANEGAVARNAAPAPLLPLDSAEDDDLAQRPGRNPARQRTRS
ncbi:MAG: hypothetical protein AAGG50_09340 [Bacteroidota bacterium]